MNQMLDKNMILAASDVVKELVDVPEWGGSVYVRSITAAERGQIEAAAARFKEGKGKDDSFARLFTLRFAAMAICDENGARLFADADIEKLAQKNAAVISRLAEIAQRLSGFGKKDMEELEKNSVEARPEDSRTD